MAEVNTKEGQLSDSDLAAYGIPPKQPEGLEAQIVAQSKASVPKPQNTLALGENSVQDLIFLMEPDKNGDFQASMDEIHGRGV
jgi:hypothetical protein